MLPNPPRTSARRVDRSRDWSGGCFLEPRTEWFPKARDWRGGRGNWKYRGAPAGRHPGLFPAICGSLKPRWFLSKLFFEDAALHHFWR